MPVTGSITLCDFANLDNGKVNLLGGGWNVCHPSRSPLWAMLTLQVPVERPRGELAILVELRQLLSEGPAEHPETALEVRGLFEQLTELSVQSVPIALPVALDVRLREQRRYAISASVEGEKGPFAWAPFETTREQSEG